MSHEDLQDVYGMSSISSIRPFSLRLYKGTLPPTYKEAAHNSKRRVRDIGLLVTKRVEKEAEKSNIHQNQDRLPKRSAPEDSGSKTVPKKLRSSEDSGRSRAG